MQKYHAIIGILVAAVCLGFGIGDAARLPEGLPNLLKTHNFNLYPVPCPANNMVLLDLKGRSVDLNALRGKVVILNFWKIDCQPCAVEKPILEGLHRKYAARGLEIVAVNLFDDHHKVESYARRRGFGFRFCSDPDNRFSVRKQSLGGGMPTTFVVNSNSEAIYEVPGVPTSYLIDRKGKVVGNAVGMVNWQEKPFTDLLECLLGPPGKLVAHNNTGSFSDAAGQGPVADPTVRQAGPRRLQGPSSKKEAKDPSGKASSRITSEDLPFQGPTSSQRSPGSSDRTGKPAAGKASLEKRQALTPKPSRSKPSSKGMKRTDKKRMGAQVEYGKPKPYRPAGLGGTSKGTAGSSLKRLAQAAPRGTVPTPYVPQRVNARTNPLPPMQPARPALPAAMPYTPPNIPRSGTAVPRPQPRPPIVPDENGQVMARVPSKYGISGESPVDSTERKVPEPPLSQPRLPSNPIDGFILDSFDGRSSSRQPTPQALYPDSTPKAPEAATPPSSVLGQLGRDVRSLGAGISRTFSGWWPGSR